MTSLEMQGLVVDASSFKKMIFYLEALNAPQFKTIAW